jgi:hypothetical protein
VSGIWKSWTELRKSCKDKKVILWGRSEDWVHKTLQKLDGINVECIVDINPEYANTFYYELPVVLPEKLKNYGKDIMIIITGGVYESILDSIEELGYIPGAQCCCSPEFKDWALLHEIREYDQNLLIACSDYDEKEGGKRYSKMGGGLYLFNTRTLMLDKKLSGHFRQMVLVDDLYYIVEFVEKLVYVVNKKYELVTKYKIDQSEKQNEKPNGCGITYHPKKQLFYVANAGSDTINVYKKDGFKHIDTIFISEKSTKAGGGLHHINDLTIADNSLLVSCFSVTGTWKKDIMDGGIFEYDTDDLKKAPNILVNSLWKPHSVKFINNKVCYLDSMRGDFWIGNQKIAGKFLGFARALAFDGRFYYVGQSEDMYMSELFGIKDNIMLNAGMSLYDAENKVSRFYSFPHLSNIHDVLIME